MSVNGVEESLSPSMDIQVSSNFERLLFEFLGRDAALTAKTMADFRTSGKMSVPEPVWKAIKRDFTGFSFSDEATLAEIARTLPRGQLPRRPAFRHRHLAAARE